MNLTDREMKAIRLLKDIQQVDNDRKLILKGEFPTILGFKTNTTHKAIDILNCKRESALLQLRELLNDSDTVDTIPLEKTRTGGYTRSS